MTVGPRRSSYGPLPRSRIACARQWNVASAYTAGVRPIVQRARAHMITMATMVKSPALIRPTRSPKLSSASERPARTCVGQRVRQGRSRTTVKLSQDRNVRSLAKKTCAVSMAARRLAGTRFRLNPDRQRDAWTIVSG